MEALQQNEITVAESGADGEPDVEDDGHELEAQGTGTGTVCGGRAALSIMARLVMVCSS